MFHREYGELVIACDSKSESWRREQFPEYKYKRREKKKESSTIDWGELYRITTQVKEELRETFKHYKVIQVEGAEADDIIGTLVYGTQEFGHHEPVMIVSADKDFIQLHRFKNVKQYSTNTKKLVIEKDPVRFLQEQIFRGDSGDGVPSILSPDDIFVKGTRQSPITQKKIDSWLENRHDLKNHLGEEIYKNYCRNESMIDLSKIPEVVKQKIINTYSSTPTLEANANQILTYLVKNRCKLLTECIGDFY
jgi:5'-3' exonuclease